MPQPVEMPRSLAALLAAVLLGFAGCATIEDVPAPPRAARQASTIELDVPRIMRGTVASEVVFLGYQPVIVRGWGLVVGLDGKGSRDLNPQLRSHMLAEMARRGVGVTSSGYGDIKPEAMLDSLDTAVVIVEAVVPPGAVARVKRRGLQLDGTRFDVRVFADPRTGTESLEGGRLYTADLRVAEQGESYPPVGSRQARVVAQARGPVFVNPFASPGSAGAGGSINRTSGRILNGGETLEDLPIKLRLATPSHARASVLQTSINTRFPIEPGQSDPTARGESDESIRITVPPSFRDRSDEFIELLRHTTLRQAGAEGVAESVKRVLLTDPAVGPVAAWRWEALGQKALPTVQSLYDHPEVMPRRAALRAGSRMGDPLAIGPLVDLAGSPSPDSRLEAINLLETLPLDRRIDDAIRGALYDKDVDVRLAAYEAQAVRADPEMRRAVVGRRFILDVIDSDEPMVYVTQAGQPRIAIFGRDLSVEHDIIADLWEGRFLVKGAPAPSEVEVYYRPDRGDTIIERVDRRLDNFITFLGHEPSVEYPEPGLGLSYGEVVGALYRLTREGGLDAAFRADQDRVLAAIQRQIQGAPIESRPEFGDPEYDAYQPGAAPGGPPRPPAGEDDDLFLMPPPILESPNSVGQPGQ